MTRFKKIVTLTLAGILAAGTALSTVSCEKKTYTVGICQLVTHDALDAATNGFKQALIDKLGEENVTFDYQNAANDSPACTTIVNSFVSKNVDLIMANATPALQAAASATTAIPILGTSITEYGVALDIANFSGTVGGNISGTSDLAPLDGQAEMLKEWFPDAKTVGLLYCSAEANSLYQVEVMTKYLTEMGYKCTSFAFTDTNDVGSVTQAACAASDVLYIPTDNTAASNTEAIANIAIPLKKPIVCGEQGICNGCGVCTLSISYYDLGYKTGEMAAKILTGEANISEMAIEYAPATKKYNAKICEELGITPVAGYEAITD